MESQRSTQGSLVSVILPVYNGERYLKQAIRSILDQTYGFFELLAIDDGSTDRSAEIIHSFGDPRIVYVRNESNLRLIATLNKGLGLAKGDLVARMDADDVAHPRRFERQVARFLSDPELAVLGTDMVYIDSEGKPAGEPRALAVGGGVVRWRLLRGSCLYHPTVMINRRKIGSDARYLKDYIHAEDYELWLSLSRRYRLDNLPEVLLSYRVHSESVSHRHREVQLDSAARALGEHLKARYGLEWDAERVKALLDPRFYVLSGCLRAGDPARAVRELASKFFATETALSEEEVQRIRRDVNFYLFKLGVVSMLGWRSGFFLGRRLGLLLSSTRGILAGRSR